MSGEDRERSAQRMPERHSITQRTVQRVGLTQGQLAKPSSDDIAVEEPLEIRLSSDTLATIMRTPGEDHYLAAGFLYSEGIVRGLADLGRVAHCGRPSDAGYGNLIDIAPGPGTVLAPELTQYARRGTVMGSACGVCGRERIDDLISRIGRITRHMQVPVQLITRSVERLFALQSGFARTGAMHGALALTAAGAELASSEDVGRHNAVDKVIGKLLYAGLLCVDSAQAELLAVSGRASFEIVQKAAAARIPVVVSVSAPTSLAIDLAAAFGITLAGFTRGPAFNLYTHPERIDFGA
jgi:FdhD protein